VIGREPGPGEAYRLEWAEARPRRVHTALLSDPLEVVWKDGYEVTHVEVLRPWSLSGAHRADAIVERRPTG
jgi:hypothetical protein